MSASALASVLAALEGALTELLQAAPGGRPEQVERAATLALELALHAAVAGNAEQLGLGCALERCVELLPSGQVDAGVALPALVMAASSAGSTSQAAVAAARYEVETLLPVPGKASEPARGQGAPDVPLASLLRRAPQPEPATDRLAQVVASWPAQVAAQAVEQVALARIRLRQMALVGERPRLT